MRRARVLIAAAIVTALVLGAHAPPAAATSHKTKPIVFVHGFSNTGELDCDSWWNRMKAALNDWGWAGGGRNWDVAYYAKDTGCKESVSHHRSHDIHFGENWNEGSHNGCCAHTVDTSIRHLAYHLAWFVRDHFGDRCVEAVGHSMGGLMLRYALARVEEGASVFPDSVCIQDVITFGTPHAGTGWALGCLQATQCQEMLGRTDCDATKDGTSGFIRWLRQRAWDPDGSGGTQWTLVGSVDDLIVDWRCAVRNMARYSAVKYRDGSNVTHFNYTVSVRAVRDAPVDYKKGSNAWVTGGQGPWPVKWADLALSRRNW